MLLFLWSNTNEREMDKRFFEELPPITERDFYIMAQHHNAKFDFPVHLHKEYELTIVINAEGVRVVGDNTSPIEPIDMVFIGPYTPHAWLSDSSDATVITLQFHQDIISQRFLEREYSYPIKDMFAKSIMGITFSDETKRTVQKMCAELMTLTGFPAVLRVLTIIYTLAIAEGKQLLSSKEYMDDSSSDFKSRRIRFVDGYVTNNIMKEIKIGDVAAMVNMSPSAFSHFFKRRTNRSFTDYLVNKRIALASKLLTTTEHTIAEICYDSGFGNISNFNRAFKLVKGVTPKEYRMKHSRMTTYSVER